MQLLTREKEEGEGAKLTTNCCSATTHFPRASPSLLVTAENGTTSLRRQ